MSGLDSGVTPENQESTTDRIVETAQDTVSSATETVQQAASAVVDSAQQATSAVTGAVADTVGHVAETAADKVEYVADTIAQASDTGDVSAGTQQVATTAVNVLDRTAEYLRNGDLTIVVEDLRSVVRRHPLRSLVIGLGLGYVARGTFFPAAPRQPSSQPRERVPSMPAYQPVPVYGGVAYDTSSYRPGEAGQQVGMSSGYVSTAVEGETAGIDTLAMNDLADTLGMGADDTSMPFGASGTDLLDRSGTGDYAGSASGDIDVGLAGASVGADVSALSDDPYALDEEITVGGDNELLVGDETAGSMPLDADDAALTDPATDERFRGEDGGSGSASTNTMPSDDLLRQWDDTTSGSRQNG